MQTHPAELLQAALMLVDVCNPFLRGCVSALQGICKGLQPWVELQDACCEVRCGWDSGQGAEADRCRQWESRSLQASRRPSWRTSGSLCLPWSLWSSVELNAPEKGRRVRASRKSANGRGWGTEGGGGKTEYGLRQSNALGMGCLAIPRALLEVVELLSNASTTAFPSSPSISGGADAG